MHVDGIIVVSGDDTKFKYIISIMHTKFALKYLGLLVYFLGIEVLKLANNDMLQTQSKHIQELIQRDGMEKFKPTASPITTNYSLLTHIGEPLPNPSFYRSTVIAL